MSDTVTGRVGETPTAVAAAAFRRLPVTVVGMGDVQAVTGAATFVTASSIWQLDGVAYRRTPRHAGGRATTVTSDGALDDDRAVPYREASLERDEVGWRLRVIPTGRPDGAEGVLSGTLEAASIALPGVVDVGDDIDRWRFPASPVPGDRDLWPGERPFTAFGQFGIDHLDLRVFDQDVYWVDRWGFAHRIDELDDAYVANVLTMLEERAAEFHAATIMRGALQVVGDALLGRVSGDVLADELGVGAVTSADPAVWLASTPLVRRLRRRCPS